MTVRDPSIWLRALILGAQGVFYNLFCAQISLSCFCLADASLVLSYLVSPKACHRFVAYLEEEAVIT